MLTATRKWSREATLTFYASGVSIARTAAASGWCHVTVGKWAHEAGIARPRSVAKLSRNKAFFSNYTPTSCYWAGFLAADGNLTRTGHRVRVELSALDREHLAKLVRCAGLSHQLRERVDRRNGCHTIILEVADRTWWTALHERFNLTVCKSLTLQPPVDLPRDMVWHFVRGYFDGDGSASGVAQGHIKFASGSWDILEWVREQFGGDHKIGRGSRCYEYRPCGATMRVGVTRMYRGSIDDTRLARKHQAFAEAGLLPARPGR